MEQVNEAQPPALPSGFMPWNSSEACRYHYFDFRACKPMEAQVAPGFLAGQKRRREHLNCTACWERQRTLSGRTDPCDPAFLMELENPLAPAAQKLAEQSGSLSAGDRGLLQTDRSAEAFADALPDHQDHRRLNHRAPDEQCPAGALPSDLTHVGYIANSIVFPQRTRANLIDPCCGTGDALLRLALGTDSQCYGIELDDHHWAEQVQQQIVPCRLRQLLRLQYYQPRSFSCHFLNPPYLSRNVWRMEIGRRKGF